MTLLLKGQGRGEERTLLVLGPHRPIIRCQPCFYSTLKPCFSLPT